MAVRWTNPRVHIVTGDAMTWLRRAASRSFDAVIVDLPDPDTPVLGRLYLTGSRAGVACAHAPGGLMVVQAGSPYSTLTAFWRTISTITAAGYAVTPYHLYVPTFGDWGFALARPAATRRRDPRCRPMRRRCAFSASPCSTPRPCSPPTCSPARWSPQRWSTRASSKTCATATSTSSSSAPHLVGQVDVGIDVLHVVAVFSARPT